MADFTVEVPISISGGKVEAGGASFGGGSAGNKEQEKTNKLLKKLDKSIIATFDPIEILTSAFKDLIQLFQPLIRVLSLLFLVIFLPLMPLIMLLVKGIAMFVKLLSGGFGGIAAFIGKLILGILLGILAFILAPFVAGAAGIAVVIALILAAGALIGSALGDLIKFVVDNFSKILNIIVQAFKDFFRDIGIAWDATIKFFKDVGRNIVDFILGGLSFIADLGVKIWEFIKGGLSFIADLGLKIWNFIKDGLSTLVTLLIDGFKGIINAVIRGLNTFLPSFLEIPELANGGIVNKPTLALIGERGPEAVIPLSQLNSRIGGNMTIQINNPVIRNDQDIKKLANEVSRVMQRQTKGRFS